jgi:hypothetical protein
MRLRDQRSERGHRKHPELALTVALANGKYRKSALAER